MQCKHGAVDSADNTWGAARHRAAPWLPGADGIGDPGWGLDGSTPPLPLLGTSEEQSQLLLVTLREL